MAYWSVVHTTITGNTVTESFDNERDAKSRYEALVPRTYGILGDLESVSTPMESCVPVIESKAYDWGDFSDVVRRAVVGMEIAPKGKMFRTEHTYNLITVRLNDGTALLGIEIPGPDDDTFYVHNMSMDSSDFAVAFDTCKSVVDDMAAAFLNDYEPKVVKVDTVNEDGASAASLGACPTGSRHKQGESIVGLDTIYGDGAYTLHESSADGFYPDSHKTMAWAILKNDVAYLEALHNGEAPTPENPWKYSGWVEDVYADGSDNYPYVYDMDRDYQVSFVDDFCRVVGSKSNQEALYKVLEYYPDFILTPTDFWNAFHKGYDKKLLKVLFDNIREVVDNDDDLNINYFGYDDFGGNPVKNLKEFLNK